LNLLREWNDRAAATAETHYSIAARLGRYNVRLGVPVVVLTTFDGTSVFATLQEQVNVGLRIGNGIISVLAGVLASLQTFMRFTERASLPRKSTAGTRASRSGTLAICLTRPQRSGEDRPLFSSSHGGVPWGEAFFEQAL
jgi:hypothetical protein